MCSACGARPTAPARPTHSHPTTQRHRLHLGLSLKIVSSLQIMYATHGEMAFADRAERIAFNALPATWASPTGGDMWAHQYLQASN
jgi:hypothetical protein